MSAQQLILKETQLSVLLPNLANAHSDTCTFIFFFFTPDLSQPLLPPLSASFISSHRLPHCLPVFPCCYFRNRRRVFRSHVVSSPGERWIMQTSLITPCANPLDWKSMCAQVTGELNGADLWAAPPPPKYEEEEEDERALKVGQHFYFNRFRGPNKYILFHLREAARPNARRARCDERRRNKKKPEEKEYCRRCMEECLKNRSL